MNFIEATKLSLSRDKWIQRESDPSVRFKPQSDCGTYDIVADGMKPGRLWAPSADDVLADDWELANFN